MASESSEEPIAAVAKFFNSQRKPVTAKDRKAGPYPYYGAAAIQDWVADYLFDGIFVLVGEDGTVETGDGKLMVQLAQGKIWVNNHAHVLQCETEDDTRYLAYALTQVDAGPFITGAAQPKINMGNLKRVTVPWPTPDIRTGISAIGRAIDDRIDLLRQANATLEAIAQALFKSWFVDFDPVRAKAEGREPEGMDAATAALFPSEFEESELGMIPRGWTTACLQEHVDTERGLSYKGAGLADPESGLPMHNLNSVLEGGGYKYAGIKFYKGDFKERHIAQAGDIIVANTEQGHHHRLIGFPAIVPRSFQRGLFSHHLYRVRIRDDSPITRHWIYRALMTPRVRDQIVGCANGSTVNMLKPAGLQIPCFVLPPGPLCEKFEGLAVSLHDQIETNVALADSLAAIRNTLLPHLISGKLRLPQAEAAEEAPA